MGSRFSAVHIVKAIDIKHDLDQAKFMNIASIMLSDLENCLPESTNYDFKINAHYIYVSMRYAQSYHSAKYPLKHYILCKDLTVDDNICLYHDDYNRYQDILKAVKAKISVTNVSPLKKDINNGYGGLE